MSTSWQSPSASSHSNRAAITAMSSTNGSPRARGQAKTTASSVNNPPDLAEIIVGRQNLALHAGSADDAPEGATHFASTSKGTPLPASNSNSDEIQAHFVNQSLIDQVGTRRGQLGGDTRPTPAPAQPFPNADQINSVTRIPSVRKRGRLRENAGGEILDGQATFDAHGHGAVGTRDGRGLSCGDTQQALASTIVEIIHLWRMRQRWHKAEKSLILQGKAICRSFISMRAPDPSETEAAAKKRSDAEKKRASEIFDKAREGVYSGIFGVDASIVPYLATIPLFEQDRAKIEKEYVALVKTLPIWKWVETVRGVGAGGLASLVGECGDIGSYKSPAALWKRMGLAVIGGERQRKVAGKTADDKLRAIEHGFNPSRRAVAWNVGNGLIGGMGLGKRPNLNEDISARDDWSPYEKLFVMRCRFECEKDPTQAREPTESGKESYSKFAAARAKRYVEKRFLLDLWRVWRGLPPRGSAQVHEPDTLPADPPIFLQAAE